MAKMKAKDGGYDIVSEQPHLARETLIRTRCYQTAWILTLGGFVIMAILAFSKGG
jgi:hypothetical protein